MPEHATVTRPRTAPVHPRRISGPVRRPLPAGPAVPRGRTGAFERLSRLPDHYVVDRLLRSRLCICVIGIMLGGIVAMQVSSLKLNAGISRAVQTQKTLELQNATLRDANAQATSGERLREEAVKRSLIDPRAGQTRFLTAHPATDPRRAARRMKPPSERAIAIMGAGGVDPTATPVGDATAAAAAGTQAPVPTPVATPVATVAAVATPVATAAVTTAPATGATAAPAGQG